MGRGGGGGGDVPRASAANRSLGRSPARSPTYPFSSQVDVKVNLGPDQEQEARMVTAAALAESARQLAQSAAEFGNEEEVRLVVNTSGYSGVCCS